MSFEPPSLVLHCQFCGRVIGEKQRNSATMLRVWSQSRMRHVEHGPLHSACVPGAQKALETEVGGRHSQDAYGALLRSAMDHFQRSGSVFIGYEALNASWLNVGWAPRLANDLRSQWERDDRNARMHFYR